LQKSENSFAKLFAVCKCKLSSRRYTAATAYRPTSNMAAVTTVQRMTSLSSHVWSYVKIQYN